MKAADGETSVFRRITPSVAQSVTAPPAGSDQLGFGVSMVRPTRGCSHVADVEMTLDLPGTSSVQAGSDADLRAGGKLGGADAADA